MSKSNNDSGLTAKRSVRLLAAVLSAVAVSMTSCHTTSQAPLDDAYYWPDKSVHTEHSESSAPSASSASSASSALSPSIEYINVQDTTVTIRIKR